MRPMNFDELRILLENFESGEYSKELTLMCDEAKYFEPIIDTRTMTCFAIKFRPWFKKEYALDYRDLAEYESFYDYVDKFLLKSTEGA